jgi:protein tyrosine/serine phosphatase
LKLRILFSEETQLLSKRVQAFLFAFLLAGSCSILPASAQEATFNNVEVLRTSVPNFGVVSPTLIRGGLPGVHGIQALKASGVKTVINLMNSGKLSDDEKQLVEKNDMKYVAIPMSHFKAATKEQMDKFLAVVNAPENQPVYVHCHQGQDRTGTMVAVYRINHEGWTAKKAYDEMIVYGFHPFFVNLTSSVFAVASAAGRPEQAPGMSFIYSDLKSRFKRAVSLQ